MTTERSPDPYPRTQAVMAFILIFWLCLIVVTVVLVGAADFEPRSAALFAIVPSVLLGWAGASYQPTRRLFASLLTRS